MSFCMPMRKAGGSGCSVPCLRKAGRARSDGVDGSRAAPSAHADVVAMGLVAAATVGLLAGGWLLHGQRRDAPVPAPVTEPQAAPSSQRPTQSSPEQPESPASPSSQPGQSAPAPTPKENSSGSRTQSNGIDVAGNSKRREQHGAARRTERFVVAAGSCGIGRAVGSDQGSCIAAGQMKTRMW